MLVASVNVQPLQLEPDARADLLAQAARRGRVDAGVSSARRSRSSRRSAAARWNIPARAARRQADRDRRQGRRSSTSVSPDWFKTYGTTMLAGRDFTASGQARRASRRDRQRGVRAQVHRRREPDRPPRARAARAERPESRARDRRLRGRCRVSLAARAGAADDVPAVRAEPDAAVVDVDQRAVGDRLAALLTRALGVGADRRERRRRDHVPAARRSDRRGADAGAARGDAVGILRRAGAAAGGARALRRHVVRRQPPPRPRSACAWRSAPRPRASSRMVLGRVALLVGLGVVAGLGTSLWAATFVTPLLYGLQPRDPRHSDGAAVVLGAIGALAGWIPAMRASRIDPARVLRRWITVQKVQEVHGAVHELLTAEHADCAAKEHDGSALPAPSPVRSSWTPRSINSQTRSCLMDPAVIPRVRASTASEPRDRPACAKASARSRRSASRGGGSAPAQRARGLEQELRLQPDRPPILIAAGHPVPRIAPEVRRCRHHRFRIPVRKELLIRRC